MAEPIHSLASFPEELLARILALCVTPPPALPSRPPWDVVPPTTLRNLPRNRFAPLLVSRQFLRIASPLFYHTLHLQSPNQATWLLETLQHQPSLAHAARKLVFGGIWRDCAAVLTLCDRVYDLDICLDCGPDNSTPIPLNVTFGNDSDGESFCFALQQRDFITHLTIRKADNVYLTHRRPAVCTTDVCQSIIQKWSNLESVHFAVRISASPITLPLAQALSEAPRLHSVRAQVPSVWSDFLLLISSNPSLEKIMLYSESMSGVAQNRTIQGLAAIKGAYDGVDDNENAILGTGMFMIGARMHARLSELIKAGTSIIRTRATTLATVSSQKTSATTLSATRAKEVATELLANRHVYTLGVAAAQPPAISLGH
ncbi:hypothetical protein BU15DRAFT_46169 [Melanogaster broomeanus]|nr:hypothetical protein BU15DRAFT_46169 [Melanogaster broomeanus]